MIVVTSITSIPTKIEINPAYENMAGIAVFRFINWDINTSRVPIAIRVIDEVAAFFIKKQADLIIFHFH